MSREFIPDKRGLRDIPLRHNVYKSDEITVNDSAYTEITPDFDAELFDIYAVDGDILVKLTLPDDTESDELKIPSGMGREEYLDYKKIKIKSVSGSATVIYYLSGYKLES